MKKIAILTSILALAACGGGSGGGGSAPIMPDAPVVPDTPSTPDAPVTPDAPSLAWKTVDEDFGLGMVDINATRSANVDKAIKIAQLIEDENAGFEHDASIARNASARKMKSAELNITQEDIDKAYATMHDIFVNHNYKDYTNHDVLVSLALIYMDKAKILELLGNGGNGLDEKIAELIGGLKDNDDFFKDAQDIYQGFGKEFDLTLKNAHFYDNSNDDDYYTFVFDDDKLVALQAKDGDTYDKDKNGSFIKRVDGYEYTFDFQSGENDSRYFSGTVDKFYKEEPSDEQLKKDIMAEIRKTHNWDEETFAKIQEILDDATLYSMKETGEEEIENHFVSRRADYADIVRIETGSKELGLRYSDFGLIYEIEKFYEQDDLLAGTNLKTFEYTEHNGLIGGYEDKKAVPTQNTTYTGASYAGLTRKTADKDMGDVLDLEQLQPRNEYYRGTAKLTIDDNMEQKLVADFSDDGWYEVTVSDLTSNPKFTFDAKGNKIHADWQPCPDTHDGKMENKNIKFYGPTPDNATEAVGLIQYIEDKVSSGDWTFKADITFGGKRD